MTLAFLVLIGLATPSPKPPSTVKVSVRDVVMGTTFVRHVVQVKNAKQSDVIVGIEVGRSPGLVNRPVEVVPPKGWEVKVLDNPQAGGEVKSYLQFSCAPDSANCVSAGQTRSFVVVMPHRSASIYGPVVAIFASGERVVVDP